MTLWTIARQAPLSMEFSRQEYWTGLPFPSPGDLPDPGIKPRCPAFQADPSPSEPPEQPQANGRKKQFTARGTEQAIEGVKRCYMSLLGRECERPRGAMLPNQLENSFFFVFLIWHFSYLFLVALGPCCCMQAFSSYSALASGITGFSYCGEQAPGTHATVAPALSLSSPMACGIFRDQGCSPCPLHWQADSYSTVVPGKLQNSFFLC